MLPPKVDMPTVRQRHMSSPGKCGWLWKEPVVYMRSGGCERDQLIIANVYSCIPACTQPYSLLVNGFVSDALRDARPCVSQMLHKNGQARNNICKLYLIIRPYCLQKLLKCWWMSKIQQDTEMSFSTRLHDSKDTISGVHVSPGSSEILVRRGGTANHRSIAYSLSNIFAKNY